MAGGTEAHNLIASQIIRDLGLQTRPRPCRVYNSDMQVHVSAIGMYTYPDVSVVCGEPKFRDERRRTLLNPSVIVEVFSPSTEGYNRGRKFECYKKLESLAEYLLVASDHMHAICSRGSRMAAGFYLQRKSRTMPSKWLRLDAGSSWLTSTRK